MFSMLSQIAFKTCRRMATLIVRTRRAAIMTTISAFVPGPVGKSRNKNRIGKEKYETLALRYPHRMSYL
jgi:hypothetical protein